MSNFDAAFFQNMDQEVDRICMLLLDAYLAQWSRLGPGGTKDLREYDRNVDAARKQLFFTIEEPASDEEPEAWVSGGEIDPALHDLPLHLAYWFEARVSYWKTCTKMDAPLVSPEALQSLLEQARVIQKRLELVRDPQRDGEALRTQRSVATIDKIAAIGATKRRAPTKARKRTAGRQASAGRTDE